MIWPSFVSRILDFVHPNYGLLWYFILLNHMDNKKRSSSIEGKRWRGRYPKANSCEGESQGGSFPPAVEAEAAVRMGQGKYNLKSV